MKRCPAILTLLPAAACLVLSFAVPALAQTSNVSVKYLTVHSTDGVIKPAYDYYYTGARLTSDAAGDFKFETFGCVFDVFEEPVESEYAAFVADKKAQFEGADRDNGERILYLTQIGNPTFGKYAENWQNRLACSDEELVTIMMIASWPNFRHPEGAFLISLVRFQKSEIDAGVVRNLLVYNILMNRKKPEEWAPEVGALKAGGAIGHAILEAAKASLWPGQTLPE